MKPRRRVAVGVHAGVIGAEDLHLIEPMLDRIGLRTVAQMPLAGEVGSTRPLEELGNGRGSFLRSSGPRER